jgi:hypothetical protein
VYVDDTRYPSSEFILITDEGEPWFDERFDRLLVSKVLLTKGVQAAGSVECSNGGTSIRVCMWMKKPQLCAELIGMDRK